MSYFDGHISDKDDPFPVAREEKRLRQTSQLGPEKTDLSQNTGMAEAGFGWSPNR